MFSGSSSIGHSPDNVLIVVTERCSNLARLIGVASIFPFDRFRSNIVEPNSRIVRRDQYLMIKTDCEQRFGSIDDCPTLKLFEFIDSIPVILQGFFRFFLDRWLRLPSLSPIFITVCAEDKNICQRWTQRVVEEEYSPRIVRNRCRARIVHRMFRHSLFDHHHRSSPRL